MEEMEGETVMVKVLTFEVPMLVLKQKQAYGNDRIFVEPVGGSGQAWIDAKKVITK